jgi:alkanesulfonate monooxygenase SsuD/methylene tetrahydromethanopterin reductase-like flavin-dependent oxidoreductase (luciferase family)
MGALGFSFVSPEAARAWVHRYYNNLIRRPNHLSDYKPNPNIAIVNGFMCAATDEEALEKAAGWTFFIFALGHYGRKGIDAPGTGDLWREYQDWRGTEKAQQALRNGLIGSPETIRKRLRMFEEAHVDQVILLNQAGKTSHADICDSLELFAREVMPEFHARQRAQEAWKQDVLAGRIELEDLDTEKYDLYAHQNEDIVRLTPEQIKQRMAEKDRAKQSA